MERSHVVRTGGCRLAELHLDDAERMQQDLATVCVVAWRVVGRTAAARQHPAAACAIALEPQAWQALAGVVPTTPIPAVTPPTLCNVVRWIAQPGRFLGRNHDGEPGVTTGWRGLRRVHAIAATRQLLHTTPPAAGDT